jgi:hypothetical protein
MHGPCSARPGHPRGTPPVVESIEEVDDGFVDGLRVLSRRNVDRPGKLLRCRGHSRTRRHREFEYLEGVAARIDHRQ